MTPSTIDEPGMPRRLAEADTPEILRLVRLPGLTETTLAIELMACGPYRWWGLPNLRGGLVAVHRAIVWGRYLFLKGVFVDRSARGGSAALSLAFALRTLAEREGLHGLVGWIGTSQEYHSPIADRLRLRPDGPSVHRYLLPLPSPAATEAEKPTPQALSGSFVLRPPATTKNPTLLVPDLLDATVNASAHWVVDRDRLTLSALPCWSIADLKTLPARLASLVRRTNVRFADVPVPAADISLAPHLITLGAQRLSPTTYRLGRTEFAHRRHDDASGRPCEVNP